MRDMGNNRPRPGDRQVDGAGVTYRLNCSSVANRPQASSLRASPAIQVDIDGFVERFFVLARDLAETRQTYRPNDQLPNVKGAEQGPKCVENVPIEIHEPALGQDDLISHATNRLSSD